MKIIIVLSSILLSVSAKAYQAVDFSPLQLQYRFEDTSAQSRETLNYKSMGVAYQRDFLRFGFQYSWHADETGNTSLHIESEKKEYLVDFGYRVFSLEGKNDNLRLDLFAEAQLGSTQTQVSTTLLASKTSTTSDNDLVYGFGAAAIGRYSYFLLETDLQLLGSKAFTPRYVTVVTIKAGITIPLP